MDKTEQTEPETQEIFWSIFTKNNEKQCNLRSITAKKLLISNLMVLITDKKLRGKLLKVEKTRNEENSRSDQTYTYEKKNEKTQLEALI